MICNRALPLPHLVMVSWHEHRHTWPTSQIKFSSGENCGCHCVGDFCCLSLWPTVRPANWPNDRSNQSSWLQLKRLCNNKQPTNVAVTHYIFRLPRQWVVGRVVQTSQPHSKRQYHDTNLMFKYSGYTHSCLFRFLRHAPACHIRHDHTESKRGGMYKQEMWRKSWWGWTFWDWSNCKGDRVK